MSMTDPIADLLTRLRNASRARLETVEIPSSKLKVRICDVLQSEGYIRGYSVKEDDKQGVLSIEMRYEGPDKTPAITDIRRMSKPGLRRYTASTKMPRIANGLGVAILSTSKGVLVDREAQKAKVGGEILCTVW
jgi:small subunit ribosomal protein S8